jgi:hypothetical protein
MMLLLLSSLDGHRVELLSSFALLVMSGVRFGFWTGNKREFARNAMQKTSNFALLANCQSFGNRLSSQS